MEQSKIVDTLETYDKSLLIKIGFDIPWDPGGFIT